MEIMKNDFDSMFAPDENSDNNNKLNSSQQQGQQPVPPTNNNASGNNNSSDQTSPAGKQNSTETNNSNNQPNNNGNKDNSSGLNSDTVNPNDLQGNDEDKQKEAELMKKIQDEDEGVIDTSPTPDKKDLSLKQKRGWMITMGIILLIFLALFIPYVVHGRANNQKQVGQIQNAKLQQQAKTNPKIRAALDKAGGKTYNADKETDDKQLSKAQVKQQLRIYNSLNSRATMILLEMHDTVTNAVAKGSMDVLTNGLQKEQTELGKAENLMASCNQSGNFAQLYSVINSRLHEIDNALTSMQKHREVIWLQHEYNNLAASQNKKNQQFLSAFRAVLAEHNIQYSVDDDGNLNY